MLHSPLLTDILGMHAHRKVMSSPGCLAQTRKTHLAYGTVDVFLTDCVRAVAQIVGFGILVVYFAWFGFVSTQSYKFTCKLLSGGSAYCIYHIVSNPKVSAIDQILCAMQPRHAPIPDALRSQSACTHLHDQHRRPAAPRSKRQWRNRTCRFSPRSATAARRVLGLSHHILPEARCC
ncbi:hypothetical protein DL89DRAFT_42290 [Linderina pennispora]|uniref:Uncharacterized protein n=1 Tax=Linderina pennispora TaxID=61395 RepID=A0A1Y1VSE5_9FUNG|nr:uncharacterized protein DL89DRAFT_42290 [Linderina pennispora]ORX64222.1 hypothetical protein DL89DRAFT_42290 [Linderina pennispora]